MQLFIYLERDSLFHRMTAKTKLGLLVILTLFLYIFSGLTIQILGVLSVIISYRYAKISLISALKQLKPLLYFLIIIFLFQLYFNPLIVACIISTRLLSLILLALLLNFTTKISDLIDTIESFITPIKHFGMNPKKVTLAIMLTIRFIPLIAILVQQIKMAQKARGHDKNIFALATPLIISSLKTADQVSDAINARSFD